MEGTYFFAIQPNYEIKPGKMETMERFGMLVTAVPDQ